MAKRTRRTHSAVFNAQVAWAAMGGDKTLAELAQRFEVLPTRLRSGNGNSASERPTYLAVEPLRRSRRLI